MTRLGLVVLLMALLAACGGPTTGVENPPKAPEGVIVGTLKDGSGAPLAGADVTLGEAEALPATVSAAGFELAANKSTKTDSAGRFAFDVDEAGEYTLTAIVGDEGAFVRVSVERGSDGKLGAAPLEMKAAPLGGVAGSVGGRGSGVWAVLLGTSFLASTDSDGRFVISRVPAGDYLLAASLLGANGAPVPVRVEPGETTQVNTPLTLGPVIAKVEPETVIRYDWPIPDTHKQLEIHGSGFGDAVGSTLVRYAGSDVTSAVRSWSDTRIVVDMERMQDRLDWDRIHVADASFSVITPAGTARSAPAGYYEFYVGTPGAHHIYCGDRPDANDFYILDVTMMSRLQIEGVTLAVTAENGTVRDAATGEAVTHLTTQEGGCVLFDIERDPGVALPVLVTAEVTAPTHFEPVRPEPRMGNHLDYTIEAPDMLPGLDALLPGPTVLRGYVSDPELGRHADDDGQYTLGITYCRTDTYDSGLETFPITLDNGNFELAIDIPTDVTCVGVHLYYQGIGVENSSSSDPWFPVLGWSAPAAPLALGDVEVVAFEHGQFGDTGRLYRVEAGAVEGDLVRVSADRPYRMAVLDENLEPRFWTISNSTSWGGWPDGWFYGGPEAVPVTASGLSGMISPQALDGSVEGCGYHACIQFEAFGDFYIVLDDGHMRGEVELWASVVSYADLNEPHSNSPDTAPALGLAEWVMSEEGAIEVVGDVDYWAIANDMPLTMRSWSYFDGTAPAVEAHIISSDGTEREVPDRVEIMVAAGELLRVRSAFPGVAGTWNTFGYDLMFGPPTR